MITLYKRSYNHNILWFSDLKNIWLGVVIFLSSFIFLFIESLPINELFGILVAILGIGLICSQQRLNPWRLWVINNFLKSDAVSTVYIIRDSFELGKYMHDLAPNDFYYMVTSLSDPGGYWQSRFSLDLNYKKIPPYKTPHYDRNQARLKIDFKDGRLDIRNATPYKRWSRRSGEFPLLIFEWRKSYKTPLMLKEETEKNNLEAGFKLQKELRS